MNLEKLNHWLMLAANVGVLAGIVFLAAEIQQSNRIAKGTAESNLMLMASEINRSVIENEVAAELIGKLATNSSGLTPTETAQARMFARQLFNLWYANERSHRNQLTEDDYFEITLNDVPVFLRELPGLAQHFDYLMNEYNVSVGDSQIGDLLISELSSLGY